MIKGLRTDEKGNEPPELVKAPAGSGGREANMARFTIHTSIRVTAETTIDADTWDDALWRAKGFTVEQLVEPVNAKGFADSSDPVLKCIIIEDEE